MDKLTSLSLSEFSKFTVDAKTELVSVPEEYDVYKKMTEAEQRVIWQAEIDEYAKEVEPDDKELIELGKSMHPYYMNQMRMQELKERLNPVVIKEVEPILITR